MSTHPVRRLLFWGAALLLAVAVAVGVRSLVPRPRPAWERPVDMSRATFPPRGYGGEAGGPVWVVRPSRVGQPDWSDYLVEILRCEGVTVTQVACSRLQDKVPDAVQAVVVPGGCAVEERAPLRRFVEGGGTLVGVGFVPPLLDLAGVRAEDGTGTAQRDLQDVPAGVLAPMFRAVPTDADTTVVLTGQRESGPWPLLLERRIGRGVVRLWCADVARSVARTRQGDPRLVGTSGLLPHPSPGDLFQKDFDPERYPKPVADTWMHRFGQSVVAGPVPIPVFWPFPTSSPGAVILTGDQDYAPDPFIDYQLAHVEDAGGEMTLFLTSVTRKNQAAGPREVAVQSPDPAQVEAWRAFHHQFSVHPNANGVPRDPDTLTAVIDASREAMIRRYGIVPRTVRHHFTFWWGYVDTAKALARLGFLMDLNYLSIVPGASGEGYLQGTGLPLPFVDVDGTVLPIFQQPTQIEDSLMMSKLGFSAGLDEAQAVQAASQLLHAAPRWGTAVTLNFHPLYSVKTPGFLDGLLAVVRDAHLPAMSAERWLDLVLRRYQARVSTLAARPQGTGLAVSFSLTIPDGDLWVRMPDTVDGLPCVQVRLDGATVDARRVDQPEVLAGTLFRAGSGSHRVEARYAPPATP